MLVDLNRYSSSIQRHPDRTTYRAHVLESDEGPERLMEFEANGLTEAVDLVVHHVRRGSVALKSKGEHVGTVYLMGAGEWWFSSI